MQHRALSLCQSIVLKWTHGEEEGTWSAQEVPQPELQPLSMEAKGATAVLKYLQLQADLLPPVTHTLQQAAQVDLWATRGAALAYTQVGFADREGSTQHLCTVPALLLLGRLRGVK